MNENTCEKIQGMLLDANGPKDNLNAAAAIQHLETCQDCRDYKKILDHLSAPVPSANLDESILPHCHQVLATTRKRRKNARIRNWFLCAGIAAVFALLLSVAVIDTQTNARHLDSLTFADENFDELLTDTDLSLASEDTAAINLELDIFANELY